MVTPIAPSQSGIASLPVTPRRDAGGRGGGQASAKDVELRPIDRRAADECVRRWHYSGKPYSKSQLHIGAFLDGDLWGAIQLGPGIDTAHSLAIVPGTAWTGYLEINRMAFADALPRNSESRALGVIFRALARHAPWVEWVVSYADATQCGDGAIYRAAGMTLTQCRTNSTLYRAPDGSVVSDVGIRSSRALRRRLGLVDGGSKVAYVSHREMAAAGLRRLTGYQVRYIRALSDRARRIIEAQSIPYASMPLDARMVRGESRSPQAGFLVEDSGRPAPKGVRADQPAPVPCQVEVLPISWESALARLPRGDRAIPPPSPVARIEDLTADMWGAA